MLGALVAGMTLTSILLLVLTPGPTVPISGVRLQAVEQETDRAGKLFDTARPWPWQAIVIHDSGSAVGSSLTIHQAHENLGRGGLGYHFVINNGSLAEDGQIDVGFRWQRQYPGFYVEGKGSDWYNRNAIGICLIGDADHQAFTDAQYRQLVWLVKQLQQHYGIPRQAVHVCLGSDPSQPEANFSYTLFSQQIDP